MANRDSGPEERFQEDLSHLVAPDTKLFNDIVILATAYAAEHSNRTLREVERRRRSRHHLTGDW